ncbi:MFS transporter [Micromonospora lutea]|uniref:MFS transporter n=1 Tax=Micromonospora lutea TaxID=419825 RepID=A0ABQ4IRK9_9ACTN|nr:MFS transporter [Micromonospora lutea]GIJ20542.1 MFS transporter [Micromonospora lutea]
MTVTVPTDSRHQPGLALLLIGSTLTVLAGTVLTPVVQLLITERHLSATAAGLIVTVHGVSLAAVAPVAGRIVDRHGVRRPLAAGLLLYGVAGGAGVVVEAYPVLIATRLLFGVGAALVFTGTTVGLLDRYAGTARDRVMGWRSTAISLGGVVWPLVGGALGVLSWRAPFAVYLLGVPLALLALRLPDEPRAAAPPPGATAGRSALLARAPGLLAVYALQAAATLLLYTVLVFLPVRLAALDIANTAVVASFSASSSAAMSVAGLGYAGLRARLTEPVLLRWAFTTWTVALLALALVDVPVVLLAAAVLFGLGMGLAVPALTVLTADRAPAGGRGRATALLATAGFTGQVASPLLLGPLHAATSVRLTFLSAAVLAGAVAAVLIGRGDTRPR